MKWYTALVTSEVDEMVRGRRTGVPEWSLTGADVFDDRIVARFHDGCSRVTRRAEALAGMPESYALPLRDPGAFAEGRFDDEIGTVVWPNGADLAPEFLRWGPHKDDGTCECGH